MTQCSKSSHRIYFDVLVRRFAPFLADLVGQKYQDSFLERIVVVAFQNL
jgi:hypothetical protein